jgi:hypothetical protein
VSAKGNVRVQIAPVALVLATLLFGSFRPATRVHRRTPGRAGVNQPAFAWEVADPDDGYRADVAPVCTPTLAPSLILALAPLIVLKTRWRAMVPVAVRHLKLPPPSNDPFPSRQA